MAEYRLGLSNGVWQKLWHYVPSCSLYPGQNFLIADRKLVPEEVCTHCKTLASENRLRLVA